MTHRCIVPTLLAGILLTACTSEPIPSAPSADPLDGSGTAIEFPVQLRSLDPETLRLDVTLNDESFELTGAGRTEGVPWIVSWQVEPDVPIAVSLSWSVPTARGNLVVATFGPSTLPAVNGNAEISVQISDYSIEIYDDDNDGFSNLHERCAASDPFDSESIPDGSTVGATDGATGDPNGVEDDCNSDGSASREIDVEVPFTEVLPVIDGRYDGNPGDFAEGSPRPWDRSIFDDVDGNQLRIDVPMIDRNSGPWNDTAGYRWFALHDDVNLYVFVLAKPVEAPLNYDSSTDLWQDDNLNLFIDGNNSKGDSYDGVDDWHVFLALSDGGGPNTETQRIEAGPESRGIPEGLRFETCICTEGRHTWEIAVPLASIGVETGRPFGIELQIDEDNDGGARDARFGWRHPPRDNADVDLTYLRPRLTGTAVLRP